MEIMKKYENVTIDFAQKITHALGAKIRISINHLT